MNTTPRRATRGARAILSPSPGPLPAAPALLRARLFPLAHRPADATIALALLCAALAALLFANRAHLAAYTPSGDDYPFVYHSSRFFAPSPRSWLVDGYRSYFCNYPEACADAFHFLRPVQNAVMFLLSLLATDWQHGGIYLLPGHLAHAACTAAVFLLSRFVGLGRGAAIAAAAVFLGTAALGPALTSPPFYGDTLATALVAASLGAIWAYSAGGGRAYWILAHALACAAVYTKETAMTAPVIAALFARFVLRERAPDTVDARRRADRAALSLLWPLPVYAAHFLATHAQGIAAYPLHGLSLVSRLKLIASGLFLSFPVSLVNRAGRSAILSPTPEGVHSLVVQGLNVLLWVLLIKRLAGRREAPRVRLLLLLCAVALVVPMTLVPGAARYLYLSQLFACPLVVLLAGDLAEAPLARRAMTGLLLIVGPAHALWATATSDTAFSEKNLRVQRLLAREVRSEAVERVVLVNDRTAFFGALHQLKLIAAAEGRPDLPVRVVNSLWGDAGGSVSIGGEEGQIDISVHLSQGGGLYFPGVRSIAALGAPGEIAYSFGPETAAATQHDTSASADMTVQIPRRGGELIVAAVPGEDRFLILRPGQREAEMVRE